MNFILNLMKQENNNISTQDFMQIVQYLLASKLFQTFYTPFKYCALQIANRKTNEFLVLVHLP